MNYFSDALSNFTTQIAYKDSIIRLYEKGLSVDEIIKICLYPVNEDIVNNVIAEHIQKSRKPKQTFIEEYDQYGHKSFRKI